MPTAIEWTDETFNPWWGCSRVSPACAHCYADALAIRYGHRGLWADGGTRRFFGDGHWDDPLAWNRKAEKHGQPLFVFCASMADVFEEHAELDPHRDRLWTLIERTPWLTWLLLTKRPENIRMLAPWPAAPLNVWLGTSIENAAFTWRAWAVQEVDAPVHFLSCEPLLGSLFAPLERRRDLTVKRAPLDLDGIEWVIGGGESGPHHRPFDTEWARELRNACAVHRVPFFWKQNGGQTPKSRGKILDGREWCDRPPTQPALGQMVLA